MCRDVVEIDNKVTVSREWSQTEIEPYGPSRAAQQTSLRKKMHDHRVSLAHKAAVSVLQSRDEQCLKAAVALQMQQQHDETCRVFRTAYYIAQNNRPYTDHSDLIELQELNDVKLGRVLHSNVICAEIIDHISCEMRRAVIKAMIAANAQCAVLIDESTSLAKASCLLVYLRTTFDEDVGPVSFFLDIIELSSTTAEGIETALLECLDHHGLPLDYLQHNWVGLGTDGASVMVGSKSGLAARLKANFPQLVSWHCFNHRLELSVNDAIKCCNEVNHFKSFMDLLYSTYSMSPKLQRELKECAGELEVQLKRIGRVLDVRWVASSCRTVKAVWTSYEALYKHFASKVDDRTLDSREKAKFTGMKRKFENPHFIQNLGLLYDALEELADLSLALQKADISLPVANKLIAREVEIFTARKDSDSQYYAEACQGVASGTFKGVTVLGAAGKEKLIAKGQFYQALSDAIAARLLPESEATLCKAVEVLERTAVPSEVSPEFGEVQLKLLCTTFGLSYSEAKLAYRDYKESKGKVILPALKRVMNVVNTVPVSTAECERGFSNMNIVCTSLRSRLSVKHMSSLMFISLSCSPLSLWKPLSFVKSWIASNRRQATSREGPCKANASSSSDCRLVSLWNVM